ncbi:MAG TPA: oligosaccharide flippase family protein [Methylomirabilota bacterium]|nr:oligosaccharide flippase family protein [Methylomirabilota bacterium]
MTAISLGRVTMQLLAARAVVYVLSLLNSIVLVRSLGAERFGGYAYAAGVAALFALLPQMGISTIVMRTIAQDADAAAGLVRAALRAQLVVAIALAALVPALAALLPEQPVPLGWIALAAAQLAIGTLSWPYLAVVGGRARYDRLAAAELTTAVAGTVTLIAAAALRGDVRAFLWAHVAAATAAVIVAWTVARPLMPRGAGTSPGAWRLVRQGLPFAAGTAAQSLYTRLDMVLLGQLTTTREVGLYGAAYKPITMATYFGTTVAGALFPLMARAPGGATPVAFERAVRALVVLGPAAALALSGLAGLLLGLLYGAEFAAAGPVLVVLAWSVAANWLYAPLAIALQAGGRERRWLLALTGAVGVNALVNVLAIPRWGAVGAALATLVSETLLVGAVAIAARALALRLPVRLVAGALVAAAVGAGVLWSAAPLGPLASTAAALAAYGAVVSLLGLVGADDVGRVLGWVRSAVPVAHG